MGRKRHDSQHVAEFGARGEELVADRLRELGYDVWPGEVNDHDLIINGCLTCEVKIANLSGHMGRRTKYWQFCLYPHPGRNRPFSENVLILRCESDSPCHFVIPDLVIRPGLTKIDITSTDPWEYSGKWAQFREAWSVIDELKWYYENR